MAERKTFPSWQSRFWARVEVPPVGGACWLWTGVLTPDGYGRMEIEGKKVLAHRAAFRLFGLTIPDGTEVDHLCRVHNCVSPAHLEAVPHIVNIHRGVSVRVQAGLTNVCVSGEHRLEGHNAVQDGRWRRCRICRNAQQRALRARKAS